MPLAVSNTITKKEWKEAYEESLRMIAKMPLLTISQHTPNGYSIPCGAQTCEEVDEDGDRYWDTIGDSITFGTAENYRMWRERKLADDSAEPYDALLYVATRHFKNPPPENVSRIWGNKTQGEHYHMCLLAIACRLEEMFPGRFVIFGDITRGQCLEAAEMASEILGKTVSAPDRCFPDKLWRRVEKFPLTDTEKLDAFLEVYLGTKDKELGAFLREKFNKSVLLGVSEKLG